MSSEDLVARMGPPLRALYTMPILALVHWSWNRCSRLARVGTVAHSVPRTSAAPLAARRAVGGPLYFTVLLTLRVPHQCVPSAVRLRLCVAHGRQCGDGDDLPFLQRENAAGVDIAEGEFDGVAGEIAVSSRSFKLPPKPNGLGYEAEAPKCLLSAAIET